MNIKTSYLYETREELASGFEVENLSMGALEVVLFCFLS